MQFKYKILLILLTAASGCTVLKPHEMVYINDEEMQLGDKSDKRFEIYIESIREGSTPTGTSKSSGGCGCN